jgi:hypothetical protein
MGVFGAEYLLTTMVLWQGAFVVVRTRVVIYGQQLMASFDTIITLFGLCTAVRGP